MNQKIQVYLRNRRIKKPASCNALLFFAGDEPIFLPYHTYTSIVAQCEEEGRFTEEESGRAELGFCKEEKNKTYREICKYLSEVKQKSEIYFSAKIRRFQLDDSDARDIVSSMFNAIMLLYPCFFVEYMHGSPDIRFPYGHEYSICLVHKKLEMRYLICIDDIDRIDADCIEEFYIYFMDGKIFHFSYGNIEIY